MLLRARCRWAWPRRIHGSRVSRISRTCRSAYALHRGECGGVFRMCRASDFNTPSRAAKLVSPSWIRYRQGRFQSSATIEKFRACCATQAAWGCGVQPANQTRRVPKVEEEQDIRSNQSTQGPDLFSKEIRRPSHLQVGVQELLPRRAFAIGDRRQALTPEHVAYVAGAGIVAEFLQLPGETFVTPRVVFSGETNNQGFGVLRFARSSGLCRRVVVGPFLLLLAAVPAQKSFGLGDGNDLRKPSLDGQAKLDENQRVGSGGGHAGGEFAAEDSVFLPQKIILQSEVAAEKLVNFGDQGVGRNLGAGAHRGDSIAASAIRTNSKGILPSVIGPDEFLHRTGTNWALQHEIVEY